MTLSELLDELREGILNDRTDRTSGTPDYLWTDARLVRYIDEAHKRFAVHGLVIRDGSTAAVTEVTLVEGQSNYTLHDSVIAVISARLSTSEADLTRAGHSLLNAYRAPDERLYDFSQYTGLNPGYPLAFSTDEELTADADDTRSNVTLRVYPTPNAAADGLELKLRVIRRPLETLTTGDLAAVPEIPQDHHIEMLDWAAYLALRIVDDDAGNPKRALEFRASFEQHVANARRTAMRKLFAPTPWGLGRNGWTWEH